MATCPNCKRNIGCSCKLRTNKWGSKGCTACVTKLSTRDKTNQVKKRKELKSNPINKSAKINKVTVTKYK